MKGAAPAAPSVRASLLIPLLPGLGWRNSVLSRPSESPHGTVKSQGRRNQRPYTAYCKKVETWVSSRADLSKPRKQVVARPAAALWRAASPGAGGTGRSAARQAPGERRPSVAARSRRAHVA